MGRIESSMDAGIGRVDKVCRDAHQSYQDRMGNRAIRRAEGNTLGVLVRVMRGLIQALSRRGRPGSARADAIEIAAMGPASLPYLVGPWSVLCLSPYSVDAPE